MTRPVATIKRKRALLRLGGSARGGKAPRRFFRHRETGEEAMLSVHVVHPHGGKEAVLGPTGGILAETAETHPQAAVQRWEAQAARRRR